ncbi:MAG: hypothetical protein COA96_10245 [SAR86 cluster bacterium]|uniref:Uncharacterized protein n=1 Tax=SAR86 cluster bacterium TaxID=2030880 RepID=A0A2A5AZ37_9GAMM|nr:MAG: hypothetical protein COA96_10245 [SAR86 cluster bacterium]
MSITFTAHGIHSMRASRFMPNNSNCVVLTMKSREGYPVEIDLYFDEYGDAAQFFYANGGTSENVSYEGSYGTRTAAGDAEEKAKAEEPS